MINENNLMAEKMALVEELGVYFESSDNLAPLASRIFVYLILNGIEGATFEELTEKLEASKSSISTNLLLLQSIGRVTYSTKCGDRKRYFKVSPNHIISRLDEKIALWTKDKNNHQKIYNYKKKMLELNNNYDENNLSLKFNTQYMEFIDKMINNLTELKQNILTIINQKE
ncbi:MAG: transcriptional regulator [Bacteroidetes bacterium HGW-Bacteroidetes-3]|jgi:DNA-binding transcriptional regulator GbsR (MarR family)|nr:MAG: transcriptional regulator [Bacteroidetes bacterium HGW-Bacteroidetes-3]